MVHDEKPSLSVCAFGAGAAHAAVLVLILPVMITLPAPSDKAQGTVAIQVLVRSTPPPPLEAAMADDAVLPPPVYLGEGDVDEDALPVSSLPLSFLGEITGALPEVPVEPAMLQEHAALPVSSLPASSLPVSSLGEITGALPEAPVEPAMLQEHAALSETILPVPPSETAEPAALPFVEGVLVPDAEAELEGGDIASVESMEAPALETPPAIVPLPLRKPALVGSQEPAPAKVQRPARKLKERTPSRQRAAAPRRARPPPAKPANKGPLGGRQATTMQEYTFSGP